jgi:hypothetical protein
MSYDMIFEGCDTQTQLWMTLPFRDVNTA